MNPKERGKYLEEDEVGVSSEYPLNSSIFWRHLASKALFELVMTPHVAHIYGQCTGKLSIQGRIAYIPAHIMMKRCYEWFIT